jgi:hypothetical protein
MKRFGLNSGYIGVDRRRDEAGIAPLQKAYLERIRVGNYYPLVVDLDAQAFLTAAGITNNTVLTAIDTLVKDLKRYGIWTKMKAIYPFVGGTSTTHKFNLKDPRDLNAAFRLSFNGGWTHSANGIITNGTNTFADTNLNPFVSLGVNDGHVSIYNRTTLTIPGSHADIYVYSPQPQKWTFISIYQESLTYFGIGSSFSSLSNSTTGFFLSNRQNSSLVQTLFINGISLNTSSVSFSSHPNFNIVIGAANNAGNITSYQRGGTNYAFASIGDGLTDTEAANYYTAVQDFQTTLGRQI